MPSRDAASARLLEMRPYRWTGDEASPVLRAGIERTGESLRLRYVLGGPIGLRIPPAAGAPARLDRLWEHTCFEAFLAPAGSPAYWEMNLSPSGDWNAYRFDDYRAGMRPESRAGAPGIDVERASCGTLTVRATVDLARIRELTSAALDVSLAAVLEANDGTLSYWALDHGAAAHPDFHRRESFVLRLDGDESA
jgi:hypothetical protein